MGCVLGKCCSRYPSSSDGDSGHRKEKKPYKCKHILTERSLELIPVPSHKFTLQCSALTQHGYYPDTVERENQDSFCIKTKIQGDPNVHFFGVFDGHGQYGAQCSKFVKDRLIEMLSSDSSLLNDPLKAYNSAFLATNSELHDSEIDDTMSGTTAITVLVVGNTLYVANVGDSRAVVAVKDGDQVLAEDLSEDQTPFRKDEYERVKLCGARVLSVDQVEGLKDPNVQNWGDEESQGGDPPRLWVPNGMYPGTAFTRSVGDSTAETIGVISVPEIKVVKLTPNHLFFVVASDGVFEFLPSQTVVNMAAAYTDPRDACAAIAGESYKLWLDNENRTDDITIIIVQIKGLSNSGAGATDSGVDCRPMVMRSVKGSLNMCSVSESETYGSVRSDFSDTQQSFQQSVSMNRSAAIVVPSPMRQRPLQLDVG
ncbi:Protein phosphatase 2C and cyclic nucleotide-binding/kinase domain-containing protein [Hibiscus syriacus]|uniref:protein-serine/threonine phosphatase n=1 Tax=Hibiscus syriacus TaxID=106335 RepID=A0A6A3BS16_HIBSY|nr:probable protein phosphatase 2C 35 [Hibiscus syriacus]KAE8717689.1 Protein phosphatase 2C and cyclic nucleotide-binding/kinase domain-containing protein [Hibiscus syriacus]